MADKTDSFIKEYKLHTDLSLYEEECDRFIGEMELGLSEKPGGLPMIHTFITDDGEVPRGRGITVMDAGGTNLRVATVRFDASGRPVIENFAKYAMPGTGATITADEMFGRMAEYVIPYAKNNDRVGVCFSYAADATEDRDAVITEFGKEVRVSGAKGLSVGLELQKRLSAAGIGDRRFTVVNDTVATLLAGKSVSESSSNNGYIGHILGTGMNICYTEKTGSIKRLPKGYNKNGGMIINVEAGFYSLYDRGDIDKQLDKKSENPGEHLFEKMISGAYLGKLVKYVLDKAAKEGLLSPAAKERLDALDDLPLVYTDRMFNDPNDDNPLTFCLKSSKEDMSAGVKLIDCVMRRAAYLSAVVVGSALLKADIGKSKGVPAFVCTDGTTYYKTVWLRKHLLPLAEKLITGKLKRYFKSFKVEDAPLIGTAVAGLLN